MSNFPLFHHHRLRFRDFDLHFLPRYVNIADILDTMESASKEEFEEMQKELEGIANPIMTKFYGAQGGAPGGGAPGGFPGAGGAAGGANEPSVEEVD